MSFYILNGVFVFIDLPKYALTSVSYSESMVYAIPDLKKTYQQQIVEKVKRLTPDNIIVREWVLRMKNISISCKSQEMATDGTPHLSRKFIPIFFMYQRDHSSRVLFRDIYIYALGGGGVDSPRVSHGDHAIFEQTVVRSLSGIQALQSM